jgi:hypothetical protein
MRRFWISIAFLASVGLGGAAFGGGPMPYADDGMGMGMGMGAGGYCDECDPCANGGRHHGHHGHHRNRNQDAGFNCGCNGSYKFPVPPLYTYHWPGMYSAQLMTDYHSPWRFPPLKPYVDEVPPEVLGTTTSLRRVQTASAVAGTTRSASRPGSFSEHVEQSLR